MPNSKMRVGLSRVAFGAALVGAALGFGGVSHAQSSGDGAVHFKISAGGRDLYKLAFPLPLGDHAAAATVEEVVSNDLTLSSFFKVLDPHGFLANLAAEGMSINPQDWRNVAAEGVIKARASGFGDDVTYDFRLYEVAKGDQPVLAKQYKGPRSAERQIAHMWASDVVKYYTGEDSFFLSRMVFSGGTAGNHRRDLYTMDWDGANLHQVTRSSQNLLPAWSPDGKELAFTSFMKGAPDLYTIPAGGGRAHLLSGRPGLNMGASWSPDGTKLAATLSKDGNSEIYLLTPSGGIIKRLTDNAFIDSSPTWSPDGSHIAFVSDRYGSPQIWTMAADGSGQQRLTRRGNYNQEPSWCPVKGSPLIAFTARDEKLAYDIFTVNASTGEIVRITEGHGSNRHPTWAPNGRAIAYESSRGGVWISTADGRTERQVYRGSATSPEWGPSLAQHK